MTKLVSQVLSALVLLLVATLSRADIVRDLYSAQVPVADQSSQALAKASRVALSEVLVKVSGTSEVLRYPGIATTLGQARSHVQQYAYARDDNLPGELSARFEFDSSFVTGLVTRSGAPLWTANRPQVLVWLVAEDDSGRYFVNLDTAPDLAQQLLAEFARRGVPVQLPLFDLADSAAINPQQAWRLDAPALRGASARYHVQDVVAGRVAALAEGNTVGDWSYFHGEERNDRSATVADMDAFFREGVAVVAEIMSARYAIAPTATGEGVSMSVLGVYSYGDYAGIVSWLESLELIEHANVERIQGDRIELRLQAQADASQLASIIELNDRLQPLPVTATGSQLSYQWN